MPDPTPEELLRLARKAWPDEEHLSLLTRDDKVEIEDGFGYTHARIGLHDRAREALHIALQVLADELDVAALVAERDRLRAELASAEERGYKRCQDDVIDWLYHRVNGNERDEERDYKLAGMIERGDHVRTGTTPPDAEP